MTREDFRFRLHCLNRNSTALSLLKYRDFQGFLITGPHSGTHWIKWMLSHALAHHYKVDPPKYTSNPGSNDLIGHPREPRIHADLPRLASTHSIAPYPLQWKWLRGILPFPPYAVVVRDIRRVLISNYEKWQHKYNVPFSEYIKGDPAGKTYIIDVWTYIRFMNRWGDVATRHPGATKVLTYEGFQNDTLGNLRQLAEHMGLALTPEDLHAGIAAGSKEEMAKHDDPRLDVEVVRPDTENEASFSPEDTEFLRELLARNLKHDFGYDFFDTPRGFQTEANPPQAKSA